MSDAMAPAGNATERESIKLVLRTPFAQRSAPDVHPPSRPTFEAPTCPNTEYLSAVVLDHHCVMGPASQGGNAS